MWYTVCTHRLDSPFRALCSFSKHKYTKITLVHSRVQYTTETSNQKALMIKNSPFVLMKSNHLQKRTFKISLLFTCSGTFSFDFIFARFWDVCIYYPGLSTITGTLFLERHIDVDVIFQCCEDHEPNSIHLHCTGVETDSQTWANKTKAICITRYQEYACLFISVNWPTKGTCYGSLINHPKSICCFPELLTKKGTHISETLSGRTNRSVRNKQLQQLSQQAVHYYYYTQAFYAC